LVGLLAGCKSRSVRLDSSTASQIAHKRLVVQVNRRPKLIIVTFAKAVVSSGVMASLLMRGLSDDLANDFAIADPARTVAAQVKQRLVSKYGMSVASSAAHADVVLEVTNTMWQVNHGSLLNLAKYRPILAVVAQLRDMRHKTVLSKAACVFNARQNVTPWRGYDEILGNHGAVLKADFDRLTQKCVGQILASGGF